MPDSITTWQLVAVSLTAGQGEPSLPDSPVPRGTQETRGFLAPHVLPISSPSFSLGLCISEPLDLTVQKLFFVDLKLPLSVVRNEQVQVQAVLYNFRNELVRVKTPLGLPCPVHLGRVELERQ